MKFVTTRDLPGRCRLKTPSFFSKEVGFGIEARAEHIEGILKVRTNPTTGSVLIDYDPKRPESLKEALKALASAPIAALEEPFKDRERSLAKDFEGKLLRLVGFRYLVRPFLPVQLRTAALLIKAVPFLVQGLKSLGRGRLTVEVLDASAISVSLLQQNFATAGQTMFLLRLSELLEEYTTKRSRLDLGRTLEIHVDKVLVRQGEERLYKSAADVAVGDLIELTQGSVIPVDGVVVEGLGLVDEAKMTGESEPAKKSPGHKVYAGTVLGEGSLLVRAESLLKESRLYAIIDAIDAAAKGKAKTEARAMRLADNIVPLSFLTALGVFALTGNATKAASVLLVDYSCAIKLTTPLSIIAALRQSAAEGVLVKGGRYLEALAEADTFVFDKTGTLTTSVPSVVKVVPFFGDEDEFLRNAACIEEHFPHSMGRAVVAEAARRGLTHDERHAEVEYVVAHGISTALDGKKVLLGSYHYIFEDHDTSLTKEQETLIETYGAHYSLIYMAVDGEAAGFLCLEDPLRPESKDVIRALREDGATHLALLTGDGQRAAHEVANALALDDYHYEVLPDDKAEYLRREKEKGRTVAMVGDGMNDSVALALADVSLSMKDSSDLAKDVADIVMEPDSLAAIPRLRKLGTAMNARIEKNYHEIVAFNTLLLALGIAGVASPGLTATAHNVSTLLLGLKASKNYTLQ